jgi:hypothetical protein
VTDSALQNPEQLLSEPELEQLAAEAVDLLGIRDAIKRTSPTLFEQIEDCDTFASSSDDSLFIATTLPIANAFIHYATTRPQLASARRWVRERWPDEDDPTSTLAALTLLYIVREGVKRFQKDPDKREVWDRIRNRIGNTLHGQPHTPNAAVA